MKQPNVVFLMVDQHNAKCLGCYGSQHVHTPNLDALASRGVRFTSAYTQCPICSPSRMCYLTGQYAHNHGYFGLRGPRPIQLPNLFSHFKGHGYHTAAIGKVHLPEGWIDPNCDFFCEAVFGRSRSMGESYEEFMRRHGIEDPEDEVTRNRLAVGQFLESIDGRPDWLPKELSREGFSVSAASEFVRNRPKDKPFLLWMSLSKPHPEYKPAQEFWDMYPEIPLPPSADDEPTDRILSFRRTWHQQHENPPADVEPRDYVSLRRRNIRGYYGNITHADWAIGQILSCLEQEGIVEDTIIVYTTDHGDIACEHGILEKAPGINSDSVCRIPYIWSWPGHLPQGVERSQLVQAIDMWPTLTSLAGLSEMSMWDGRNITDCLMDERKKVHEAVFTENPFLKGITTERWRMIRVPEGMFPGDPIRGELYDRCKDPWERTNLFHSPTYSSIVQELTEKMLDWLITSHRPISALPVLPHPSVTWADDPMNDPKPHPEDGKTSPNQIWDCIRKGIDNYL